MFLLARMVAVTLQGYSSQNTCNSGGTQRTDTPSLAQKTNRKVTAPDIGVHTSNASANQVAVLGTKIKDCDFRDGHFLGVKGDTTLNKP
jgi:hypothetical protein